MRSSRLPALVLAAVVLALLAIVGPVVASESADRAPILSKEAAHLIAHAEDNAVIARLAAFKADATQAALHSQVAAMSRRAAQRAKAESAKQAEKAKQAADKAQKQALKMQQKLRRAEALKAKQALLPARKTAKVVAKKVVKKQQRTAVAKAFSTVAGGLANSLKNAASAVKSAVRSVPVAAAIAGKSTNAQAAAASATQAAAAATAVQKKTAASLAKKLARKARKTRKAATKTLPATPPAAGAAATTATKASLLEVAIAPVESIGQAIHHANKAKAAQLDSVSKKRGKSATKKTRTEKAQAAYQAALAKQQANAKSRARGPVGIIPTAAAPLSSAAIRQQDAAAKTASGPSDGRVHLAWWAVLLIVTGGMAFLFSIYLLYRHFAPPASATKANEYTEIPAEAAPAPAATPAEVPTQV